MSFLAWGKEIRRSDWSAKLHLLFYLVGDCPASRACEKSALTGGSAVTAKRLAMATKAGKKKGFDREKGEELEKELQEAEAALDEDLEAKIVTVGILDKQRGISSSSGIWSDPSVRRRERAFAAWCLMPARVVASWTPTRTTFSTFEDSTRSLCTTTVLTRLR